MPAIRWDRGDRHITAKKENLIHSGITDGRKALERFARLLRGVEAAAQPARKVPGDEPGNELETGGAQLRNDAAGSQRLREHALARGEKSGRGSAHRARQRFKALAAVLLRGGIAAVGVDDELVRVIGLRKGNA